MTEWIAIWMVWGSLGILAYIYGGYLLALFLCSRFYSVTHTSDKNFTPTITVLFAARNEIASLPAKFESLRNIDYPKDKLQILVASDASNDGTNEFLAQQNDVESVIFSEHQGKNASLNTLLTKANGDILFFTDANTLLHPQCLHQVAQHFYDGTVGMVTGELVFTQDPQWNPVGRGSGLYWRYENSIKELENNLGSVLVGSGSVLAARRELVHELDPRIANDLEIPAKVGALGYKILFEPNCIGYEKPHTSVSEEIGRTSRIVARGLRGFWVLLPTLLKSPFRLWQFFSHKFLRWFTLVFFFAMLLSASMLTADWLYRMIFYVGLTGTVLAFLGMMLLFVNVKISLVRPLTLLGHLFIMQLAALWGLLLTLRGKTPSTWTIPTSSR